MLSLVTACGFNKRRMVVDCGFAVKRFLAHCLLLIFAYSNCLAEAYETPAPASSSYPIPRDAIFVSAEGSDTNIGTTLAPLATVGAAVRRAFPGATIVLREGVYREQLPVIAKPLTLQPFPNEKVWLKGSVIVSDWEREGAYWRARDFVSGFCNDCFDNGILQENYPAAGFPEQVFINGRPLKQVGDPSRISTDTFFRDTISGELIIGSDPAGRIVEVSNYASAIELLPGAEGTKIRGLGFAHYSPRPEPGFGATIKVDAADFTFENNIVAWSSVKGIAIFAPGALIRGNTFIHNGMMGLGAWRADGIVISGNLFAHNNLEHFAVTGPVSEAAGAKITQSKDISIIDNIFEFNRANGLWLDINVRQAAIVRNIVRHNENHGIFYEISSHALIASNLVYANDHSGIAIADSAHVDLYNNTLVANGIALVIQDDGRQNDDPVEIAAGNNWEATAISSYNNFMSAIGNPASKRLIWIRDFTGKRGADEMLAASDHNAYQPNCGSNTFFLIEWYDQGNEHKSATDLQSYQGQANNDLQSVEIDCPPSDAQTTDTSEVGNGSRFLERVNRRGRLLPDTIADAIGIGSNNPPLIGTTMLPSEIPLSAEQTDSSQ